MKKYSKIFEDINSTSVGNYCTIISYEDDDDNFPDVYLCDNEELAFIYLKNFVYEEYSNHESIRRYKQYLTEYSAAKNTKELYKIYNSRNRFTRVYVIYNHINEDVELEDWIINFDLNVNSKKFNI